MKKAVVLLSGGMDSAVTLYIAGESFKCYPLTFDYNQKASRELEMAVKLASFLKLDHKCVKLDFPWTGSSLTDPESSIPDNSVAESGKIPSTYVPARNMIFLSIGISLAETIGAEALFIGAHQIDYSNYPDCREGFLKDFQSAVESGTRSGVEDTAVKIVAPVIDMTKKDIVLTGAELKVPFELTWSCYDSTDTPCGVCESCSLRRKAFQQAGIEDPIDKKV